MENAGAASILQHSDHCNKHMNNTHVLHHITQIDGLTAILPYERYIHIMENVNHRLRNNKSIKTTMKYQVDGCPKTHQFFYNSLAMPALNE